MDSKTEVDERVAAAKEGYAGFTITCDKCGSNVVIVQSDAGYSELSGSWGGVYLQCGDCHHCSGYIYDA